MDSCKLYSFAFTFFHTPNMINLNYLVDLELLKNSFRKHAKNFKHHGDLR